VSDQRDTPQTAYLQQVSADLTKSLRRCHLLVDDYRAQLIPANSNQPHFMLDGDGEKDKPER
jgi:hypothetical protein